MWLWLRVQTHIFSVSLRAFLCLSTLSWVMAFTTGERQSWFCMLLGLPLPKEREGVAAEVLMATPCTNSLGGESGGHKHEECEGCRLCWKFAAVSWSGAGGHLWVFLKIIHDTDRGKKKKNVTGTRFE